MGGHRLASLHMSNSCPSCGNAMEYAERTVVLRSGTCPACQKALAFVEGATISEELGPAAPTSGATPVGAPAVVAEDAPECDECGTPLVFRSGRRGGVLAECPECETTVTYRLETEGAETEEREPPRPRGGPGGGFERGGPRGRPCRKCGAPLTFSTNDEGMLVGECTSCGNRFTLPPREEGGRREFRPPARGGFGRREYGGRSDRGGSFRDRDSGGARPYRRPYSGAGTRYKPDDRRKRRRRDEA